MTAAPHARAFDALEIEAEIGCVPLDDAMRGQFLGYSEEVTPGLLCEGRAPDAVAVVPLIARDLALGNATADPSRQPKPAIERACEWAEAVGYATRAAHDICHDCPMDWPRRDVLVQWHLFAWATRARRDLIARYRKELTRAIGRYRRTR